jgi:D-lactate dehydrogenase
MSEIAKSVYQRVYKDLSQVIPGDRVSCNLLRRLAMGTDASFYRLVPEIVVEVNDIAEVQALLAVTRQHRVAVTFRAAGTSLSGQAVTDSVLVCLGWGWQQLEVIEQGAAIRLQSGVVGADANQALRPYQRKIGPDPASINSARMGGIAANNASGMCCGTAANTYSTLRSMQLVLADGALLDTADENSCRAFERSHAALLSELSVLAQRVRDNSALSDRIRHKYRLKNTMGYALNALLDYQRPLDILTHLMVGSEGTLGFIGELVLDTVADHLHKATALVFFPSAQAACELVPQLKALASAVELIDQRGLQAVADSSAIPGHIDLESGAVTALLVELDAANSLLLEDAVIAAERVLSQSELLAPLEFSQDASVRGSLWALRKGLFPAVGAVRAVGTTVIIEDIAVPVSQLGAAVTQLQMLFQRYQYDDAVIFGHAGDGNLHFVFSQSFASEQEVTRYQHLMQAVVDLVVGEFDGSLKAEHGTGRNMAPFVEREWGGDAYALICQIKQLFDPLGLLNPGVIVNSDPRAHLKHLKPLPVANPLVDRCVECGFCEPTCPSRRLTLTPRQRIAVWRNLQNPDAGFSERERRQLAADYDYQGKGSCAACGMCELSCPVSINTGDLTRALRAADNRRYHGIARWLAKHYAGMTTATRMLLRAADAVRRHIGDSPFRFLVNAAHRLSRGRITAWHDGMPHAGEAIAVHEYSANPGGAGKIIYFPACMGRVMDPAQVNADTLVQQTVTVLNRAGFDVVIPRGVDALCCGLPFDSKGFADLAAGKRRQLAAALYQLSDAGKHPVYCDTSACTQQLLRDLQVKLEVVDTIAFLHDRVLPRLQLRPLDTTVALHTTCSASRQGLGEKLQAIAKACAADVFIPRHISCCGFAGDKGFTLSQLNRSALADLKQQLPEDCSAGYSTSVTCEIGLTGASGIAYRGIVDLLEQASRDNSCHR